MKRSRKSDGFRNTTSKNGELSPRIKPEVAVRLKAYTKLINKNVSLIVNEALAEYLDMHETEPLMNLDKEQLAKLYLDSINRRKA